MPIDDSDYQAYLDDYGERLSQSERFTKYLKSVIAHAKNEGYNGDEQRWWTRNYVQEYLKDSAHLSQQNTPRMNAKDAENMANQIVREWDINFDEGTNQLYNDDDVEYDVPTFQVMYIKTPTVKGDWRRSIGIRGVDDAEQ